MDLLVPMNGSSDLESSEVILIQPRYHTNLAGLVSQHLKLGDSVSIYCTRTTGLCAKNVRPVRLPVSRLEKILRLFQQVNNFQLPSLISMFLISRRSPRPKYIYLRYTGIFRTFIQVMWVNVTFHKRPVVLSQHRLSDIQGIGLFKYVLLALLSRWCVLSSQVLRYDVTPFNARPFVLLSTFKRNSLRAKRVAFDVVFVAKEQARKNIGAALDALAPYGRGLRVLLIIQTKSKFSAMGIFGVPKYRKIFDKLEVLKNVKYERMPFELRRASIYVDYAVKEPASIGILEAWSLGLVIMSSEENGSWDLLKNKPRCFDHKHRPRRLAQYVAMCRH